MEYEAMLVQYKDAVDKSSIFSKTDVSGTITYVNDKFCEVTEYSREELLGHTHAIIKDPTVSKSVFKEIWKTITAGNIWNGVLKNIKKGGGFYYVNSTIYPIKDSDGKILEYISIRQDITELIKSQQLLEIYSTDTLTHLPNRKKLNERLKSNEDELMAILLDIKDFIVINDLYGENIADLVLVEIAKRLNTYIKNESVILYKLDADRYLILVDDASLFSKYESLIEFTLLSEDNFIINDIVVTFNISMATGSTELLSKTSLALKEAKKTKSRYFPYNDSINTKEVHKLNLKRFNDFKDALINDRIEPFFQPIVDANTEEVVKYESLARIRDADGNIIAVSDFLSIAEKSSFFENFTRQIIQKIFAISKASNKELTINLTYENINSEKLLNYIENRLKMHKGPAITFELLESEEISDYSVLENFSSMVKKYGSLIAIDDFGTGYSNFTHLSRFKADFVKIDGSIISKIEEDENSRLIVSILVEYAKRNNIKVIAEYVSSPEIAKMVRDLGVDLLQGYHYGKAESAAFYNLTS
ncbi:diguanylate cyclase/phosphodiesterase (GGDEF & EAL domains) with PAS/PAC sensor(s) [Sulfurimonas gotlandica GD1]|uniref:Diguanylate cyclase/phosphodiesterase (GGDEF & EAL domains) with PAS/PAC sensor(S) n=1 Tax=Sulfurimonas gotlandica (strain DSM 19862 / JCM 16533 / GD1) TaxID=929558 RepID=B6BJ78_SULGG|nr:EAL domain-containing protein [Sulfurimonas gotlandica]EDZ63435.1 diguanylate cyclase/phosphodiesterase with PAS/PAC and GAF sensor [Sulfurimonas gotlandica GD1]EHP30595.1 diguanylate cyclase/phosphodiesterase (GGDEF & EAL domains) with PAS/PAC sensor(s) [Sulfurimonas gotlandica GD1]